MDDERPVLQEADCKNMVDTAVETFGGLHVAFNNAGVYRSASLADITEEEINAMLDINVKSLAFSFKYQVPRTKSCSTTTKTASTMQFAL